MTPTPEPPHEQPMADARELADLRARMERLFVLRDEALVFRRADGTVTRYDIALPADSNAPLDQFAISQREPGAPEGAPHMLAEMVRTDEHAAAEQARAAVRSGVHMPYWGLLWPSGVALAEAIHMEPWLVRGRRVLELGCGLGLTATAGLNVGADLLATDCFDEALLFSRFTALRNCGKHICTELVDWRTAAGRAACEAAGPFALVLAADVLYEQENIEPLLDLVPRVLQSQGMFWLAEPGRRVSRAFVDAARAAGWMDDEHVYDRAWPPDGDHARVVVHRFTLPLS